MATIVLSAVGAAMGASIGGGILGLSSVALGRAAGAIAGSFIDHRLTGGSDAVESGAIDRVRIASASEGAPMARLYGRARIAGQVIWASEVTQVPAGRTGSGKGTFFGSHAGAAERGDFRYLVSLAYGLCEGEITHIGRIWADGQEVAPDTLSLRVYTGAEDQMPDPKIEAVEGAGNAPAYRGTAYVVIEDLDLSAYGNRIPSLNFEVFRPEQPDESPAIARGTKAVAIIPGTGEYGLATTVVHTGEVLGEAVPANENTPLGKSDFAVSVEMLQNELPNLEAASLVVSWFGDDLRCDACTLAPLVEHQDVDGQEMPWNVAGMARADAGLVPRDGGTALYGGTPTDASVIEAIQALRAAGKAVTFYPFILMTQQAGNSLTDPWTGAEGQPALPWRGRITTSRAPGQDGSPDGTAQAEAEVAAFFGTAQPGDFTITGESVAYAGPDEWSYRRFILHYAALCKAAGGVDAFLIGSEMRGLTQIRGAGGFPAVAALVQLAADVRAILGPDTLISYAADWSEYFGYQPQDGSGDRYYHLDPLWSDANIDFIGIDNYMPLSDWREGREHADAHWGSIYNLDYLKANILGGEGYDWFYHAPEAEAIQLRTPITDDAYGEPWVWRYKDLPNWWMNGHYERIDGVRSEVPTDWVPGSKPIWFTEMGCAAIDKGTNQPNKFLDPKSSESRLPKHSNGRRDDFMQMQYLRAQNEFWAEAEHNPTHPETGVRMLDMSRAHVWAWDARPFPWFPGNTELWSDAENYMRGHWLNGRATNRPLASVVREICADSGVEALDLDGLHGVVRGYAVSDVTGARNMLQPLMLAGAAEAAEREGVLRFFSRDGVACETLETDRLAMSGEQDGALELIRAAETDVSGRVRVNFIEASADYEIRATEAAFPDEQSQTVSQTDMPLILLQSEGRAIAERWLAEARIARDRVRFALPPSQLALGAGDVVEVAQDGFAASYRIDHADTAGLTVVEAVRVEPAVYTPAEELVLEVPPRRVMPPVPVTPIFMDLPLLRDDEAPHQPHLAVTARPWPGPVAVYASADDTQYKPLSNAPLPAVVGVTENVLPKARAGVIDRGAPLKVRLTSGTLSSATLAAVLNGANAAALGDGSVDNWEIIQFTDATLVGDGVYEISGRLRGQAGSDALMPEAWPVGTLFVLLDDSVTQLPLRSSERGLERHFRVGPAVRPLTDSTYTHAAHAFAGVGLRPLAPVHLAGAWSAGGLGLSWIRRGRVDADSWLPEEIPLGEARERYRVRVLNGGDTVRTAEVTSPSWTYTPAMQAEDGLAWPITFEVAQLSQSYGEGLARRITVSA